MDGWIAACSYYIAKSDLEFKSILTKKYSLEAKNYIFLTFMFIIF